jgi:hypothetical protein
MTTQNSVHFNVSRSHGWKDALVVSFLAIVLGAFVAQISSTPTTTSGSQPMASVSATVAIYG